MNALAFGAGSVDLFAGDSPSRPYFKDTNGDGGIDVDADEDGEIELDELDDRAADATGLVLENVDFGLLIMRPTLAALRNIKHNRLRMASQELGCLLPFIVRRA